MSFTKGLVRALTKVTQELRIAMEEPEEEEVKIDIEEHTATKKAIEKILLALFKSSAQALAKLTKQADQHLDPQKLNKNKLSPKGIEQNKNLLEKI